MTEVVQRLLRALVEPTPTNIAALADHLDDAVRAVGPFISGNGKPDVLEAIEEQLLPVLASVSFGEPIAEGNIVTITGTVPAGGPVAAVRLTVAISNDLIVELIQEVDMPALPPPLPVRLVGHVADAINEAFQKGIPLVVAYVDNQGSPHVSFRGAVHVYSPNELAIWIRNPRGGLPRNIVANPSVALIYRDPATRDVLEISGRARIDTSPTVRANVYDSSPHFEQSLDPFQRGEALLITVDKIVGRTSTSTVNMTTEMGDHIIREHAASETPNDPPGSTPPWSAEPADAQRAFPRDL